MVTTRAVMVTAQGMANQDNVVARGVELAVGFVADSEAGDGLPALKSERLIGGEVLGHNDPHAAGINSVGSVWTGLHLRHSEKQNAANDEAQAAVGSYKIDDTEGDERVLDICVGFFADGVVDLFIGENGLHVVERIE